jgi:MFS family permease
MLMFATGLAMTQVRDFWPVIVVAFFGTLNASMDDVSIFLPIEHALIGNSTVYRDRTRFFSYYSTIGALSAALGAFCAQAPDFLSVKFGMDRVLTLQLVFLAYSLLGVICFLVYRNLPKNITSHVGLETHKFKDLDRKIIGLTALFSLDALGGGMIVHSMMSLYLITFFGLSIKEVSEVFVAMSLISATSFLVVPFFSKIFGLFNMLLVFHIPASLILIALFFVPTASWAVSLLLIRSAISSMDVPARASYVMSLVTQDQRAAAASLTNLPRSVVSSMGPWMSGLLMSLSVLSWPLLLAGGIKLAYAGFLWKSFRTVRPHASSFAENKELIR